MAARKKIEEKAPVSISALVDRGYELDKQCKICDKELKLIKSKLKDTAKSNGETILEGDFHKAVISEQSRSTIDAKKFFKLMKAAGKEKDFWNCISVGVEKAKEHINEFDLEEISTKTSDPFGKISFK